MPCVRTGLRCFVLKTTWSTILARDCGTPEFYRVCISVVLIRPFRAWVLDNVVRRQFGILSRPFRALSGWSHVTQAGGLGYRISARWAWGVPHVHQTAISGRRIFRLAPSDSHESHPQGPKGRHPTAQGNALGLDGRINQSPEGATSRLRQRRPNFPVECTITERTEPTTVNQNHNSPDVYRRGYQS